MNVKDLRIGNIVTIDNGGWSKLKGVPLIIAELENETDKYFPKSNGTVGLINKEDMETYCQFSEFIAPIPLSKEVLLACGFEFNDDDSQAWDYNGLTLIHSGDFEGKLIAVGHGLVIDGKRTCCYLSSLHELQNLYYTLTKNEIIYQP